MIKIGNIFESCANSEHPPFSTKFRNRYKILEIYNETRSVRLQLIHIGLSYDFRKVGDISWAEFEWLLRDNVRLFSSGCELCSRK